MAAFKSAKGHPGNMAKPKFSLFPADVWCWGIFFVFWDGMEGGSLPTGEKHKVTETRTKGNDRDVMMMTRTKSHEIVFWHKTKWHRVDAILYKPTKSTTKQRKVFRTVHGFRIPYQWAKLGLWTPKRLTPSPCESFSPKPSPATAVRWVPIWRTFLSRALLSKKSRHEVWMNLIIFHQPGIFPWFSARTPIFATPQKKSCHAQFPEPRAAPDDFPGSSFGHHSFQFIRLIYLPQKIQWNQLHRRAQIINSKSGVVLLPTQTMHYCKGNPQNYHRFLSFWSHQYG